jgi:hypothetical protein
LYSANELSKTGASLHNAYDTALTAWDTQNGVVAVAQGKVDIATIYKTKVDTDNTAKNVASASADTAYTTVNGELTTLKTDLDTKTSNETTQKTLAATKKAEWESLKAQVVAQTAEEAAQLAI